MQISDFWDDPEDIAGFSGRKYYRIATINWSRPRIWRPDEPRFRVPDGWAGQGGIYAFIRSHWKQTDSLRISYVGKANSFSKRLTNRHQHFDLVEKLGDTKVSCGRVSFSRIRSHVGHYLELEDVIKFCVHDHLENSQGFETLPGFRKDQPRAMIPWLILNEGYRFGGLMPRRIAYPWIAVDW